MKKYNSLEEVKSEISNGSISCEMLVEGYLKNIEENTHLNAFLEVFIEEARYTAKMQMAQSIDVSHLPPGGYVARAAPGGGMSDCLTFYHFTLTN